MNTAPAPPHAQVGTQGACAVCGRQLGGGGRYVFKMRGPANDTDAPREEVDLTKCLRCALRHRPLLRRSLYAALVVGTVLTLLNQGDVLFAGQWSNAFYWKVPLTYSVPFIVSTYGALTNVRQ